MQLFKKSNILDLLSLQHTPEDSLHCWKEIVTLNLKSQIKDTVCFQFQLFNWLFTNKMKKLIIIILHNFLFKYYFKVTILCI